MKKNVRRLAVLTVFVMLLTLVPFSAAAETKMRVTGDYVNLRDLKTNQPITTYNRGTVVTLIDRGNGYMYHIRVDADGNEGRMYCEYLEPYSASAKQNNNTTTTAATNYNNNTATTAATNYNNNTARTATTNYNNTARTTNTAAVRTGNNQAAVKQTNPNAGVPRNNDTVRGMITKPTSVRATANSSSKIVGTLKTRTTVSVLSRKGNMVYITTANFSGYVPADCVMLTNTTSRSAKVIKTANGNNKIYSGSNGTGKTVGTVSANSNITVLHSGENWSYVKVGNVYGYISRDAYTISKAN